DREYREWAKENYDDVYEEIKAAEVSAEGPVLGAYDPSKTVSEEELITGKSNRYTPEQLRTMWSKLSPESQSELTKARQANWFINGGPIRATLFKKVIEPFGNMLDSVLSNPIGEFLSRSTYIPGVSVGVQESTGNETADKVSSFIGSNVAPYFVPTGAPFGSGPIAAPYEAANKLLNTGVGQQAVSKLGTGIGKIPFVTSNFAQGIARVGLAEGMAGGVQNPASMLVNNSDRGTNELLMDSAIGFGAGFALGMGGYAIGKGIGAGVSKVLGKGNVPDSIVIDGMGDVSKSVIEEKKWLESLQNTENFKQGTKENGLNHIFDGEILKNGNANGFHYEGMPNSSGKIVGNIDPPNEFGVYQANIEINGVVKGPKSTFFPKEWTPQQVIDAVNEAFNNKVIIKNNKYIGETGTGMEIEFILRNDKIISAYPVY
ncbi:EndoU domain-containing protein, partial [Paenibacillus anaericanus]|uniref:EndoU domain-containing protein n=2 Tax=Paenibacillus TaxID=44249 RepID=UPI001FEB9B28